MADCRYQGQWIYNNVAFRAFPRLNGAKQLVRNSADSYSDDNLQIPPKRINYLCEQSLLLLDELLPTACPTNCPIDFHQTGLDWIILVGDLNMETHRLGYPPTLECAILLIIDPSFVYNNQAFALIRSLTRYRFNDNPVTQDYHKAFVVSYRQRYFANLL